MVTIDPHNPASARDAIRERAVVTPQLVLLAKQHVLAEGSADSFLGTLGLTRPAQIVIHPNVDIEAQVNEVADAFAAQTAFGEAVWALIGAGLVVPRSAGQTVPRFAVQYTTVYGNSGGESSGWDFEDLAVPYPDRFSIAPSRAAEPTHLTDADLFLATVGGNIHPLIAEALAEAVRCLRADLYLPAIAMLGKATEGAWTLLAVALAAAAPDDDRAQTLARALDSDRPPGFAELVRKTLELYTRQDTYGELARASGVSLNDLRESAAWTDVVRDSRNVVHFAVETPIPNTYEKAAALFLGVPHHLGAVLRLAASATPAARRDQPQT